MAEPGAPSGAAARFALVIFDFDGTLADSWPWAVGAINDAADRFGFRRADGCELEALRGLPTREILRRLQVPLVRVPRIAAYLRQRAVDDAASIPRFVGVDVLLPALAARGIKLAVASSNAEATVRQVLGPALCANLALLSCGASLFGKDARLRQILRRLRVPAAQAILIGDEVRDIEAARAVGIACGAVLWGYATPALLRSARPDVVFSSVDEIAPALIRSAVS